MLRASGAAARGAQPPAGGVRARCRPRACVLLCCRAAQAPGCCWELPGGWWVVGAARLRVAAAAVSEGCCCCVCRLSGGPARAQPGCGWLPLHWDAVAAACAGLPGPYLCLAPRCSSSSASLSSSRSSESPARQRAARRAVGARSCVQGCCARKLAPAAPELRLRIVAGRAHVATTRACGVQRRPTGADQQAGRLQPALGRVCARWRQHSHAKAAARPRGAPAGLQRLAASHQQVSIVWARCEAAGALQHAASRHGRCCCLYLICKLAGTPLL